MNKFWATIIMVLVAGVGAFSLLYFYAPEKLEQLQRTDIGAIVNEIKKEVSAPSPLKIFGKGNATTLDAANVIAQTNIQRYANGKLPRLTENAQLTAAAKAKAQDMFAKQYFEHVSPTGVDPGELVKNHGYDYILTGENLILGTFADEKEMVQLWMESPGHRANILHNRFTEIGVAVLKGEYHGETVWIGVQEFGLPMANCTEPSVSIKSQIDANKAQLDMLAMQIDQKRDEINNTNQRSPQYNQRVDEYNVLVAEYNGLNEQTKNLIAQYNAQVNAFNACVAGSL